MSIYYPGIVKVHDVMNDGGRLGEITKVMEDIGEWAKVQSERILTTPFLNPEHEEANIAELGEALLFIFDNFGIDSLRYRNGTSFQFGTVFNSERQPVFTIRGIEFYSEDGKKYNRFSEIPVNVVVCYWYNDVPRGWFMKSTNHEDPKKPLFIELEKAEVDY